eukprot:9455130-Lingulodinium_polyedra.AAC.1
MATTHDTQHMMYVYDYIRTMHVGTRRMMQTTRYMLCDVRCAMVNGSHNAFTTICARRTTALKSALRHRNGSARIPDTPRALHRM